MGDKIKDKMGDASVDKLCESMQKLFAQLVEQSQQKSKGTITLEPNPVRLSGPGNYFSWSRHATLILGSHGLKHFLDGTSVKPDDKLELEQWEQNEQRVMVWLLGSMEPLVREQVENLQTTAEVWKEIGQQLSGKTNKMQVTRVLHEMRNLKQGERSITDYAGELKRLYRDLEFFRPFKSNDPKDLALLREWFQPILVQTFLEGLNQEFDLRRQMIYSAPDWPTLDEAVSSVLEEETRLSNQVVTPHASVDIRAALSSQAHTTSSVASNNDQANTTKFEYRRKPKVVCDHCKQTGHIKKNCFDLIGYPPGWQQRHGRLKFGDARGKKQDRVRLTSSTSELSAAVAQALEEFKSKLLAASNEVPAGSVSSYHASQGTEDREGTWDWHRA